MDPVVDTLFLVQHCPSQHHVNGEARLWPDGRNGLTELGQRQARCLAERLHEEMGQRPCRVYTSPMQRAAETAEIVRAKLETALETVYELHEFNGRFALERSEDGQEWPMDESGGSLFDGRPFPEAETWREFYGRVATAMARLAREHEEDRLPILVVHGGTLSNLVVWWLGLPLDALPERTCFSASPGSLSILKKSEYGNAVIERLNDRAHLAALCQTEAMPKYRIEDGEA